MSEQRQTRAWFAPKQFGYGATPSTWEGWAATIGYGLIVFLTAATIAPGDIPHRLGFHGFDFMQRFQLSGGMAVMAIVVESAAFIALTRWKSSGPWLWRWGQSR